MMWYFIFFTIYIYLYLYLTILFYFLFPAHLTQTTLSGLILQDLTFVHVGNEDYLDNEGNVNFTKCWLQFDILVQMRRFRNW